MKHTRTTPRSLRRGLAALLVAGLAVAGMTACDPNTPADCTKDCIDIVSSSTGGDGINVYLTGTAVAEVTIYSDAARLHPVGYARNFVPQRYNQNLPITKAYQGLPVESPELVNLKPGTKYHYRVKATSMGSWRIETGSFKTMQRTLTVKVDAIELYWDSDAAGAAEITADMRLNGGTPSQIYQNLNWPSGPSRTIGVSRTYPGVMPKAQLQVRLQDDDCELSTCKAPAGAWDPVGSNGDVQWATATIDITMPNKQGVPQSGSFVGQPTKGGVFDLGFRVYGTWTVSYTHV